MMKRRSRKEDWRYKPADLAKAERCFDWWIAGQSVTDVAGLEKCTRATAHKWIKRGRLLSKEAFSASHDDHRAEQVSMTLDIYQAARKKTDDRTALDALKHLARLIGTEAPTKLADADGGPITLAVILAEAERKAKG